MVDGRGEESLKAAQHHSHPGFMNPGLIGQKQHVFPAHLSTPFAYFSISILAMVHPRGAIKPAGRLKKIQIRSQPWKLT